MDIANLTPANKERLRDPKWRVNHLYKIVDKKARKVTFKYNQVQAEYTAKAKLRNINLKARQQGYTTLACIEMLDECLFRPNFNAVIIAHDEKSLYKIFKKVQLAWNTFALKPTGLWVAVGDKANELAFNNGSSISVALSSRSDTVHRLHVSEFGKMCRKYPDKALEVITGAIPSVPPDGRIDIESTAEGEGGDFFDMFWAAWDRGREAIGEEWTAFFSPWYKEEAYTTEARYKVPDVLKGMQEQYKLTDGQFHWYIGKRATLKALMGQEYPTTPEEAFVTSGDKVFDADILKVYAESARDGNVVGDWTYFTDYKPGHVYALGADVSEGIGKDSSTAVILDMSLPRTTVVARYKSNRISPTLFAYEIKNGATRYGSCIAAVERNNHGHATLAKLQEIYANVYVAKTFDKLLNRETDKPGWLTSTKTKPIILFNLKQAVEEFWVDIPDRAILKELRMYDNEDLRQVRFDDETTRHFDLVMALAIAYEMRNETGSGMISGDNRNPRHVCVVEEEATSSRL